MTISKSSLQVTVWIFSVLFAGNIYFVKRLVDQLDNQGLRQDKSNEVLWQLRQDVTILKIAFDQKQLSCKKIFKGE